MSPNRHIVVLGAGVTGLTSAVILAEAGYTVTIIAKHVPGDLSIEYASPWAGAHWRTHAQSNEPMLCDWDVQSYKFFVDLIRKEETNFNSKLPRLGLALKPSFHFWDGPVDDDLWWAPHVQDFRQLSEFQEPIPSINRNTRADQPSISEGVGYRTIAIDSPQYLLYLQERARASGAIVFQSRLPTDAGMEKVLTIVEGISSAIGRGKIDCFVNATGLGAMSLCGDNTMFPVRGQTVLVKGEAHSTRTRTGDAGSKFGRYAAYCIPRPGSGTTILGGTRQKGDWSEEPDPEITKQILERGAFIAPELRTGPDGGFEVVSVQCGLRPGREGGPRIEKEEIAGRKVVHAYGHAGGGYQSSIGSARMTLRLVKEFLGEQAEESVSSKL